MALSPHMAGFDGTTGRSDHGGRRTHIIQVLRDSPEPVSVADIAAKIGVPATTARFHLEALADAGMAERVRQSLGTPGRPRVLYAGILPNQTHERAQAYRLLAEALIGEVAETAAAAGDDPEARLYTTGTGWGGQLARPGEGPEDEDSAVDQVVAKLDALWFAPEREDGADGTVRVLLHHYPFVTAADQHRGAVSGLYRGMIDGMLARLGSTRRVHALTAEPDEHRYVVTLTAPGADHQDRASAPGRA